MAFIKTGDAPISAVYCQCGGQIDTQTKKCKSCGKDHDQGLVRPEQDKPTDKK
jgi:hypothetical protein